VFRRAKSLVGLDIGSSAIKVVELKAAGRGYRVATYGSEPLPPDSIVDGAIIDGAAVADAIRRLFDARGIRTRDVAASLSGNAVIVKKITLPTMTQTELAESIYWEAEQYIPFDIQDVNLDYEISDDPAQSGQNGQGTMAVLLVAAKKDKIADYANVITQAGRTAAVVDVDAFALQNAYEANYGFEPGRVVVLLNAGASAINVNIVAGMQSVFTRDVSIGGNAFTEAVQKELDLPFDTAEQVKTGQHADATLYADAKPVLRAVIDNALLEVEKTFDFYKATAANDRIDRIVLSGGASRVDGFADALHERFGTLVERFNPFRQVALDSKRLGVNADDVAPVVAVALGLALRRSGDR
jgi:type IV pilus assembly protein PilM